MKYLCSTGREGEEPGRYRAVPGKINDERGQFQIPPENKAGDCSEVVLPKAGRLTKQGT